MLPALQDLALGINARVVGPQQGCPERCSSLFSGVRFLQGFGGQNVEVGDVSFDSILARPW